MGQYDRGISILVVECDARLRGAMASIGKLGVELTFLTVAAAARAPLNPHDVMIVSVDCEAGLTLLTDVCNRPGAPAVIAVCGTGFDGKSPEHLLILAELRGAATLPLPVEPGELVMVASGLAARRRKQRDNASDTDHPPYDQAC